MDVLSKEYFSWLSEETKDKKSIYCVPGLHTDDNVLLIEELFKKIDEYVKENYFFNIPEYGNNYCIRDGDNKYVVSVFYGQDISYMVKRDNNIISYIDIDDVRKKTVHGRENMEVLYRMKAISLYLKELDKMGVPMDMVEEATKREFRLIKVNKKRTC